MIIQIQDELDLSKIAESGQCFRVAQVAGQYRFMTGPKVLYIRPLGAGRYEAACSESEWQQVWSPYFDLQRNYAAVRRSIAGDAFMRQAAESGRGVRVLRQDPWEMLVTFIISQRKSIPAIQKAVEALASAFGTALQTEYEALHTFPTPQALCAAGEPGLRQCGLGYRVPYVQDAARKVCDGTLRLDELSGKSDGELLDALKGVKGVGDKVANCVMLFAYGRTARVPVDVWIQRIMQERYAGADPFAPYGENAGIMQQYAFYYVQHHKDAVK